MVAGVIKGCRTPALTCIYFIILFLWDCRQQIKFLSRRSTVGLAPTLEFCTLSSLSAFPILISVFMREFTAVVGLYLWERVRCVRHFFECRCWRERFVVVRAQVIMSVDYRTWWSCASKNVCLYFGRKVWAPSPSLVFWWEFFREHFPCRWKVFEGFQRL